MSQQTNRVSEGPGTDSPVSAKERSALWKSQHGMKVPSPAGPMLADMPKSAKISPMTSNKGLTVGNTLKTVGLSLTKDSSSSATLIAPSGTATDDFKTNGVKTIPTFSISKGDLAAVDVKEGMAQCEHCAVIGVKHAFYTKDRNFCSPQCVKAVGKKSDVIHVNAKSTINNTKLLPIQKNMEPVSDDSRSSSPNSLTVRQDTSRSSSAASLTSPASKGAKKSRKGVPKQIIPVVSPPELSFDWSVTFRNSTALAAPVSCFKHVPVSHVWDNVTEGMKVEVRNVDIDLEQCRVAFWVASVIRICGYNVLLRFEGFGDDASRDFWANLCTAHVHPVGWCATKGKPLVPPLIIASKYSDWRDFLVGRLTGARTLPQNLQSKVENALRSKFEVGTSLEVVDKNRICRVRLATVKSTVGKRLNMMYFDSKEDTDDIGFWCHEESPLIHPCGWAATVGHEILAPAGYNPKTLSPTSFKFKQTFSHIHLKTGMKLEVIDPLNLSAICAATVKRVLKYGYIMVRVDCYEEDPQGSDWFCHHVTSPNIFPCEFSRQNSISLTPPYGYDRNTFNWNDYFNETHTTAAKLYFYGQEVLPHNLKEGMKLEAADLMDPRLICVATVGRVVGSLLKIRFDGWEEEYDQWLDASSPDIYPVGYCELVGHKLEKPPQPFVPKKALKAAKKGRKKVTKRQLNTSSSEASTEKKAKELKAAPAHHVRVSKSAARQSSSTEEMSINKGPHRLPENKQKSPSTSTINSNDPIILPSSVESQESAVAGSLKSEEGTSTANVVNDAADSNDSWKNTTDNMSDGACDDADDGPTIAIPKLTNALIFNADMPSVDPDSWTIQDVGMFLKVNDCGTYCDSFEHNKLDGPKLLALTKDQIIVLTKMKVGPAVKILDLICHLRRIANHARARKENKSKAPT